VGRPRLDDRLGVDCGRNRYYFLFDFRRRAGNSKSDAITRGSDPRWFLRFAYEDYKRSPEKQKDEKSSAKKKV
jgi:hypothetical protein